MGLALSARSLEVQSASRRTLLNVAALDLAPGEVLGIAGPSGAGKTTLLHAMAGLSDRMSGDLRWAGTDLVAATRSERAEFRRKHLGLVFQDHMLFEELTAQQNAAIAALYAPRPQRAAINSRASDLLDRLGIAQTGRPVASFSGGERQRVAIARAFAGAPKVLLADEPTASLDRETADRLSRDLIGLVRNEARTMVVVSHDRALLDMMDRVVVITDGRLEEGQ